MNNQREPPGHSVSRPRATCIIDSKRIPVISDNITVTRLINQRPEIERQYSSGQRVVIHRIICHQKSAKKCVKVQETHKIESKSKTPPLYFLKLSAYGQKASVNILFRLSIIVVGLYPSAAIVSASTTKVTSGRLVSPPILQFSRSGSMIPVCRRILIFIGLHRMHF